MSRTDHCSERRLVDRHFAGSIGRADEKRLRRHLATCQGCRAYYQRHRLLAEMDPVALSLQDRLGRGLGVGRPMIRRGAGAALAAAGLAAALLAGIWLRPSGEEESFRARGGTAKTARLEVYRLQADGKGQPVSGEISAGDELAFAFRNPAGKKYLMVFALDGRGRVFWYHPAWKDSEKDPAAVPIKGGKNTHELREAIRQKLKPGPLTITGLFLDRPLGVKAVEKALRQAKGKLNIPGATVRRIRLRVK